MLNLAECVCKVEIEYDNHGKRGIGMGQVNLYKIDAGKKAEFIEKLSVKFESLGEQDYQSTNDINDTSKKEPDYLDRTWLMHGRCCREVTRMDCVQLINALDVCEFMFNKPEERKEFELICV